jgi:Domain of unknown function (DUF4440)
MKISVPCAAAFAALFFSAALAAEAPTLNAEILAMDKQLFDAFNARDLETTKAIFDPSLEFYHDAGGLAGYEQSIENTRRLFANAGDLRRELVPGSVEIYPIKDFGAIETGEHRFCHTENQKLDCGTFKFLHIWKRTDSGWKLVRVVSYAH